MSDTGRKDLSTQVKEGVTPESQKSYLDQAKEATTDAGDKVAATLQPGDNKSTTQKLSDQGQSGGQGILGQLQEGATNLANQASEVAGNLYNSVAGSGTEKK